VLFVCVCFGGGRVEKKKRLLHICKREERARTHRPPFSLALSSTPAMGPRRKTLAEELADLATVTPATGESESETRKARIAAGG
jgi:hypothetical protein